MSMGSASVPNHSAFAAGRSGEVESRLDREQARIDQGVESGQLTAREYDHLQSKLDNIDASYEHDLDEHGGHLTAREARNLNARENGLSNQIYFDKHNLARQPGAPPPDHDHSRRGEVEARIDREQSRIDQGVESGQLTSGEYDRLQSKLDAIKASYQHDLSEHGGHLTAQEARSLNGREDNLSRQIYFDKHNLARQPGAPAPGHEHSRRGEVEARIDREQSRIDQGVESGQLTFGEYNKLENGLDAIKASYEHDLKEHGGHLTAQEARNLNNRENNLSNEIYFDKHNLAHQPGAPTL